jgi:TRAP-type C4-dicarboxylate transport system permease small subunit
MLDRVARYINKVMLPVSRIFSNIGMVATILLVIVIVVGVCSRRFFNMPIRGLRDLTVLGFSIMVFLPMAWCAITNAHVSMNTITSKFPKSLETIIGTIVLFITTGTLAVLTWQLYVYGVRVQTSGQVTALMSIPVFPFLYLATLGMLMMTIVFFMKFLVSLDAIWRRK